ncbi:MAG: hypothetical protein ACRDI0_00685 [Actinomycetota bacterium]
MILRKLRRGVAEEVRSEVGPRAILLIDDRANSLGLESRGALQIRGNGCLAATAEAILFRQWLPRKQIRIPRARIIAIERVRWHLGKSYGRPLLKVRFTSENGQPDSIAWYVRDLEAWEATLGVS